VQLLYIFGDKRQKLPARFFYAWKQAFARHLSQADAAKTEIAVN